MIAVHLELGDIQERLGRVRQALEDLTPVWPAVHRIVMEFFAARFRSEGAYAGTEWVALSPTYAARKRREVGDKPILQYTGQLLASLTEPTNREHVYRTGPSFMETGTSWMPRPGASAWAHQLGVPQRNLPARPIMVGPTEAEGERIVDAIEAYIYRSMQT